MGWSIGIESHTTECLTRDLLSSQVKEYVHGIYSLCHTLLHAEAARTPFQRQFQKSHSERMGYHLSGYNTYIKPPYGVVSPGRIHASWNKGHHFQWPIGRLCTSYPCNSRVRWRSLSPNEAYSCRGQSKGFIELQVLPAIKGTLDFLCPETRGKGSPSWQKLTILNSGKIQDTFQQWDRKEYVEHSGDLWAPVGTPLTHWDHEWTCCCSLNWKKHDW